MPPKGRGKGKKEKEERPPTPEPATPPAVEEEGQEDYAAEQAALNRTLSAQGSIQPVSPIAEAPASAKTPAENAGVRAPIPEAIQALEASQSSQGNIIMEEVKERTADRMLREAIEAKRKQNLEDKERIEKEQINKFMEGMGEALQRGTLNAQKTRKAHAQRRGKAPRRKDKSGFVATKKNPRERFAAAHRTIIKAEEFRKQVKNILLRQPNTRNVGKKMSNLSLNLSTLIYNHNNLKQNISKMSTYIQKRQEAFVEVLDKFKKEKGKRPSEFKKMANSYNDFTKQQIKGALDEAEQLIKEYNEIEGLNKEKKELENQEKEITKIIEESKKSLNSLTRKQPRKIIEAKKLAKHIRAVEKAEKEKENVARKARNV